MSFVRLQAAAGALAAAVLAGSALGCGGGLAPSPSTQGDAAAVDALSYEGDGSAPEASATDATIADAQRDAGWDAPTDAPSAEAGEMGGWLDPTFGEGGIATLAVASPDSGALDPDPTRIVNGPADTLVVVGEALDYASRSSVFLARVLPSGAPDPTFGRGGSVDNVYGFGQWGETMGPTGVAVDPQGNATVGGVAGLGSSTAVSFVARHLASGALDTTFGTGAVVAIQADSDAGPLDLGGGVLVDATGRILLAGERRHQQIALWRFTSAGAVDPGFGDGGTALAATRFPGYTLDAIDVQSSGKLVTAGCQLDTYPASGEVARFLPDGTLDTTFGSGGQTVLSGSVLAAVVQPADDKIVVAGDNGLPYDPPMDDVRLWRLTADGALDPTFGTAGEVTTVLPGHGLAIDVALQADGRIVVTGTTKAYPMRQCFLARYSPEGALDSTFGTGGVVLVPGCIVGRALVVDHHGKIVVTGAVTNGGGSPPLTIWRYVP